MAQTAAKAICGEEEPYSVVPWFWSNQFGIKLQTVGLSTGYDQAVVRGDAESGRFSDIYLKNGQMQALDCVNRPADFVQGRKLVEMGAKVDPDNLGDETIKLKVLVPPAKPETSERA